MMSLMLRKLKKRVAPMDGGFTKGERVWMGVYLFSEFCRFGDDKVLAGKDEILAGFDTPADKIPPEIRNDFLEIMKMLEWKWNPNKKAWRLSLK